MLNKVNIVNRIIILILLILGISIANSKYLLISFTIYFLFLALLTNKSVKFYIDLIKNVKLWLLFIFIIYIIMVRNVLLSAVIIYKIILILLYIKQFSLSVDTQTFLSGIYTLMERLKFKNSLNISYNIVIFINFINYYINSKKQIFSNYNKKKKIINTFSLKYNILPRMFLSTSKINKLESDLKLKYIKPRLIKNDTKSNIILFIFILLFIIVVIKEVIM